MNLNDANNLNRRSPASCRLEEFVGINCIVGNDDLFPESVASSKSSYFQSLLLRITNPSEVH